MLRSEQMLHFSLDNSSSQYAYATIHVAPELVKELYQYIITTQQQKHRSLGFSQGNAPLKYIEQVYQVHIIKHVKEFLFNYCVADCLVHNLRTHKCVLAEKPILEDITIDIHEGAKYVFRLYENPPYMRSDWKHATLTQPMRKKYKDIDRQVNEFLKYEVRENTQTNDVQMGDWLLLRARALDPRISQSAPHCMWLKVGCEETDQSAHSLFLKRYPYTCFITEHPFLEHYFSEQLDAQTPLGIEIVDRVPHDMFSLRLFRHQFGIRNTTEMQSVLTQVFSYRNDISQRREIIDKAYKHLFKHFQVSLNEYLIEQQRKQILQDLYRNPDYYVYRAQSDFEEKIYLLAKKQLKETMITDYIGYAEGITVSPTDMRAYLNLTQRPRTKPFIYFTLPHTQVNGQEMPLSCETVHQACFREKTLNYIIRQIFTK